MQGFVVQPNSEVLVVGAGPVGLTAAAELARHGVRPRIIDRMKVPSPYCRAIGVTSRTLEVWDDMGIARDMIDAGIRLDATRDVADGKWFDLKVDLSDLPFAMLGIPQNDTERLLTLHLSSFGVDVERGISLDTLSQSNGRVETVLTDSAGGRAEASFQYVIGCDGAHSAVRRALAIPFEGSAIPVEFILGDVHIDWNVPRGIMLRVIRPPIESSGRPDIFIAVPLPEMGRYRVSIIAPPELGATSPVSGHGIQSERPAPGIEPLQAAADNLLPKKGVLSDLRWSSIYRISMRLAASYRKGNVFIAGDAAHIHPPTGGQGMNTGIQDAYNLAWKMALVLKGVGKTTLLDSYEAERLPVGQAVVARTSRSVESLRREKQDRLADTQVLISYRGGAWVENSETDANEPLVPIAGERAPDCQGLRRVGVGFPIRLFDILRGIEHVLIAHCPGPDADAQVKDLALFAEGLGLQGLMRCVAIVATGATGATASQWPGVAVYSDAEGTFGKAYGLHSFAMLVRPDGHLAWRGESWRDAGLLRQVDRTFRRPSGAPGMHGG